MIMKEDITSAIIKMQKELEQFSYLDKLLYIYTLIFLKVTLDTLYYKEMKYIDRYGNNSNMINRLMDSQNIITEKKWEYIYESSKYSTLGYNLNEYLRKLEERNPCLYDTFKEIDFTIVSHECLKNMIEILNKVYLNISNEEDKKSLESSIDEIILDNRLETGDYRITAGSEFTPKCIAKTISKLIEVKENETVGDLVCGSGGLILEAIKRVTNQKVKIYCQEIDKKILKLCRLNLFLHGIYDAEIKQADIMTNDFHNIKLDVIVANPPFSIQNNLKERIEPENKFLYNKRYPYGIPPMSKGDYAYIQNMLLRLHENGRMATIISLGALSRTGAEEEIRKNMIKDNVVETIILLPPNLFRNTQIKACIMILKKDKKQSDILFIDASKKFEKGRMQNYISKENIEDIIKLYKERKTVKGHSYLASLKEVLDNNGNLSVNKYIIQEKENFIDIEQLTEKIKNTEEYLNALKYKKQYYKDKLY